MLGLASIPSIIMFIGLLFMPESPRWLIFHKKPEKAWKVLQKIHPPNGARKEFDSIMEDFKEHSKTKMGKEWVKGENLLDSIVKGSERTLLFRECKVHSLYCE